jgi:putative ABC transport system permease protein
MLKKEYIYIGTLSAMGYKKMEIVKHYLLIPIVLSIISSILGIAIGYLLIDPFKTLLAIEYNVPKPIYKVEFYDLLLVSLVPLILNVILCYMSIRKALKINIVTLLKGDKDNKSKKILKSFKFKKIKFQNRFKIKELIVNIPRTITMTLGLTISFMLLLTGFLFSSACDFIYGTSYPEIYGYKYQYLYKNIQNDNGPYEKYMLANFSYNGKSFMIQGIDTNNNEFIKPKDENGNYIDTNKTIILKSAAKKLKIHKGDKIKIINDVTLKEVEIVIDEIADIKIGNIVYMPLSELNNILDIDSNSYIGVYTKKIVNIDNNLVKDIITLEDNKAGMEFAINLFNTFLIILSIISGTVSIIVVLIVSSLLIEENFKNISTLKVLGYSNKEISNILLKSPNIILPISFLLSIPITSKLITTFFDVITKNMYFDFNINIKLEQYIISYLIIFIFTNIAIIISKRKINKVNLAESLKFIE